MLNSRTLTFAVFLIGAASTARSQEKRITPREDIVRDAGAMQKYTNIALLVGIGDYDRALTGLSPLKYTVPDITAVGSILKKQGYEVALLTDRAATAGSIRESIRELGKALDAGQGTFLFYFSGHGFRTGTENYLATFGTTASDLANQGLSMAELQKLLVGTGARRRLAFIDACRNDPEGTRSVGAGPRSFQDLRESEGLRILYSTAPGEVSYEDDNLQHGVFSYFLIEGLQGKAANEKDGLITFDDLRQYLTKEMRSYGISRRRVQKPYQLGDSTGDFLLGKRVDGPVLAQNTAAPPPSPAPSRFAPPVNPAAGGASISNATESAKAIKENAALDKVGKRYRSTLDNRLYSVALDPDSIIVKDAQSGHIVADLRSQPNDRKFPYKGQTKLGVAAGCPGGSGTMRMKPASPTRLEVEIITPVRGSDGKVNCMVIPLLGTWQKVSFILDN